MTSGTNSIGPGFSDSYLAVERSCAESTIPRLMLILRRDLKLGPDVSISESTPLLGGAYDLDSLDVLMLLTSVEKEFSIKIPNEDIRREAFSTVGTLAAYIDERRGKSEGPGMSENTSVVEALPHAPPFRFISLVTELIQGVSVHGVWCVDGAEDFFKGHFPGNPIVPGMLLAEALAQASGLVVGPGDARTPVQGRLAHADVRFLQSVKPPAEIMLKSALTRSLGQLHQFGVEATVNEAVVAHGTLTLAIGSDERAEEAL